MAQLSSEERIARVEQAPAEVQTMVAKAFLREDIDDEDVQYLFNAETPEEMNDEDVEIENLNADDPEGIGASGFVMRTTRPANNKNYIVTGSGGWSPCIKGNPTYAQANALANCVGYACGRFNEIINEARGTTGCTYKNLNSNAVNFKERAEAAGLKTGSTPRRGAIICWGGGSGNCGHVETLERVDSNNQIYTSSSGWGSSSIFWNSTRNNNNGRWGLNSNYYFRCFIYLPDDVQKWVDGTQPTPAVDPFPGVSDEELAKRVWTGEFGNGDERKAKLGIRYDAVQKLVNQGYGKPDTPTPTPEPPKPEPTPAPTRLQIGDKVKIVGTGKASSYGDNPTAGGIGWERYITNIYEGRPYPYQVGNQGKTDSANTTGFYKADALERI